MVRGERVVLECLKEADGREEKGGWEEAVGGGVNGWLSVEGFRRMTDIMAHKGVPVEGGVLERLGRDVVGRGNRGTWYGGTIDNVYQCAKFEPFRVTGWRRVR